MIEEFEKDEGKPNVTISVTSGSFPMSLFLEWDKDCKKRFGNCRWMKMWHDHQAANYLDIFKELIGQIDLLSLRLSKLEKKPIEKKALTLGGKPIME